MQPSHLVAGMIVLKGLGGFLFVFGSPFGAYLLVRSSFPFGLYLIDYLYTMMKSPAAASDSYSHHQSKHFIISILLQLIYLAFSSPILYDFYNYEQNESKYIILLNEFLQVCPNLWLLDVV